MLHVQLLHGHTLKSATFDYEQRHVIAFRPISVAAHSWSYDKSNMFNFRQQCQTIEQQVAVEVQWMTLWTVESRRRLHTERLFLLIYCLVINQSGKATITLLVT